MSIFGKIKDAIFGKKAAPAPGGSPQAPTGGGTITAPPPTAQPQTQVGEFLRGGYRFLENGSALRVR